MASLGTGPGPVATVTARVPPLPRLLVPPPRNTEAGGAPGELAVPNLGGGGLWLLGRAPPLPAAPAGSLICGRPARPRPADSILCAQTGAKIRLGWKERDAGAATAGEGQALQSRRVGVWCV